ncbi:unnamed protein product [Caenorhabditis sp. 36 PRJEB53466]|nr:unnamed protein product [Caenorhabditis sp. 36 PRJEB53466]
MTDAGQDSQRIETHSKMIDVYNKLNYINPAMLILKRWFETEFPRIRGLPRFIFFFLIGSNLVVVFSGLKTYCEICSAFWVGLEIISLQLLLGFLIVFYSMCYYWFTIQLLFA